MIMNITDIDTGINTYSPSTQVMWSAGRNVRFKQGRVHKTLGKSLLKATGVSAIRGLFTFSGTDGAIRTIVCFDNNVYAYNQDFSSFVNITPNPAPTGGASDVWNFSLINGLPILTNGKDRIWKWPNYSGALTVLANSPRYAKAITNSLHRLMCGNVNDNGNIYTSRILWSKPGEPESLNINLEHAGRHDLVKDMKSIDSREKILTFKTAGRKTFVYTERNIWVATPIESPELQYSWDVIEDIGLIAPRLAVSSEGTQYFMGVDNFYALTDTLTPIGLPIRDQFLTINKSAINTGFAFEQRDTKEVFFCVPTGSNTTPDTAFIYNKELKNWTFCDVDYLCHGSYFDPLSTLNLNIVGDADGNILKFDSGYSNNGKDYTGFVETGDFVLQDDKGSSLNKFFKSINSIIPTITPQDEQNALMIQVGTRASLHHDISWSLPVPYTIGISEKANFRKQGKYVRIKFYTELANTHWEMQSFMIDFTIGGQR